MGDRCYLSLFIHGHIKTVDDLRKIVHAIEEEGLAPQWIEGREATVLSTLALSATKMHDVPEFFMDECNYADISAAEKVLQEAGVAYLIDHGAGSEYPAGASSWTPERGSYSVDTNGSDAVLDLNTIEAAMASGELDELIQHARWANGKDMPAFTVSPEVMAVLAKALAVKAHNIQHVTAEMIFSNPGEWMK